MSSRIRSTLHRLCVGDEGQTTVETAFGLAALVTVMVTALSGLVTIAMYLGLTDAAGAIARAEAGARLLSPHRPAPQPVRWLRLRR